MSKFSHAFLWSVIIFGAASFISGCILIDSDLQNTVSFDSNTLNPSVKE